MLDLEVEKEMEEFKNSLPEVGAEQLTQTEDGSLVYTVSEEVQKV